MKRPTPLSVVCTLLRCDALEEAVLRQTNWFSVVAFANAHLITPALYTALAARDRLHELPTDVLNYLAQIYEANLQRNRQLIEQVRELTPALNAHGIRPMLLKGATHFFASAYDDIGSRIVGDIDLLVPTHKADAAADALERLGYTIVESPVPHTPALFRRPFAPAEVDLHLSTIDPPSLLPASDMLDRAQPIDRDGLALCVPSPSDRVMHVFLHAQIMNKQHYHGIITLRDLLDFARLSSAFHGSIDWEAVRDRLRPHGLATAITAYALSAHRLFGMPLPSALRPLLLARPHQIRSEIQLRHPALHRWTVYWGALRTTLARHRLVERYGNAPLIALQTRHCARVLRTHSMTEIRRKLRT